MEDDMSEPCVNDFIFTKSCYHTLYTWHCMCSGSTYMYMEHSPRGLRRIWGNPVLITSLHPVSIYSICTWTCGFWELWWCWSMWIRTCVIHPSMAGILEHLYPVRCVYVHPSTADKACMQALAEASHTCRVTSHSPTCSFTWSSWSLSPYTSMYMWYCILLLTRSLVYIFLLYIILPF